VVVPPQVLEVHVVGQGADRTPKDERNLVVQAAKLAFQSLGVDMPSLRFECTNAIPFGAGMGSSSAAIIAGVVAAFAYLDHVPDELHEEVLQVAVKLEGHVDNIAPCLYGGLRIGWQAEDGWRTSPVSVPDNIRCVLFVPDAPLELSTGPETKTQSVRAILSPSVSRHDAVYNIARSALLVNAFASNQLHLLKHAMQDTLHQVRADELPSCAAPLEFTSTVCSLLVGL
jgi:homoserine kinase